MVIPGISSPYGEPGLDKGLDFNPAAERPRKLDHLLTPRSHISNEKTTAKDRSRYTPRTIIDTESQSSCTDDYTFNIWRLIHPYLVSMSWFHLPARPTSPLTKEIGLGKSRLSVTKTHCFYPPEDFLSFQSCLLAFKIVFQPLDSKARIEHSGITLSMFSDPGDAGVQNPIIKAIYPTPGILHRTRELAAVNECEENSASLSLGIDPYGNLALREPCPRSRDENSWPYVLSSGIGINTLLLTMSEDPIAPVGFLPPLDFAVLIYLPSPNTSAFEARLTVKVEPGGEFIGCDPGNRSKSKLWTFNYDGVAEVGRRTMESHPDRSRSVYLHGL